MRSGGSHVHLAFLSTLTPAERVDDLPRIVAAMQRAVREAIEQHRKNGYPIAVWPDGAVVWIPPEDIPPLGELSDRRPRGFPAAGAPSAPPPLSDSTRGGPLRARMNRTDSPLGSSRLVVAHPTRPGCPRRHAPAAPCESHRFPGPASASRVSRLRRGSGGAHAGPPAAPRPDRRRSLPCSPTT
jgi:hypothetical protein